MINSFRGDHAFLSNFYPSPIRGPSDLMYATVEHAYQASKSDDPSVHIQFTQTTTPGQAKKMGRHIRMVANFNNVRISIMRSLIKRKFNIPAIRNMLVTTDWEELIEGNYWGDTFWGVCNGTGHNHLGKLLMAERVHILSPHKPAG